MASPTYHRPGALDEALALLAEHGYGAKVLAGGQSLIPMMSLGLARPGHLVDIGRIPGLHGLTVDGSVAVGPLVRHRDLAFPPLEVDRAAPLLAAAAPLIGHEAVRNRGTFIGSLAHGDPAAEWPAVAVALDAEIELRSTSGQRTVPAAEFYLGPLTTVLEDDELLVGVRIPVAPPATGAAALELAYRHGDYAVVGVVAQITRSGDDGVADARVALLSVGPTPIRARAAEAIARSGPAAFADAGAAAAGESDPSTDATASADYRRRMVAVFVRRALEQAYARASVPGDGSPPSS
jgi:aerobic carbon-monoxide dehydrogenase medium subunit